MTITFPERILVALIVFGIVRQLLEGYPEITIFFVGLAFILALSGILEQYKYKFMGYDPALRYQTVQLD